MEVKEVEAEPNPGITQSPRVGVPSRVTHTRWVRRSSGLRARRPWSLLSTRSRSCRVCPGGSVASLPGGKAQPCLSASCQALTPRRVEQNPLRALCSVIHSAGKHLAHVWDWMHPWFISNNCSHCHRLKM